MPYLKTITEIQKSLLPGAYELPKVAKEHKTEFHVNPNHVTVFVLHHAQMALQPHEVETSSPPSKKGKTSRKTQPTLPLPCVTGHAQFRIWLQRFYFNSLYGN